MKDTTHVHFVFKLKKFEYNQQNTRFQGYSDLTTVYLCLCTFCCAHKFSSHLSPYGAITVSLIILAVLPRSILMHFTMTILFKIVISLVSTSYSPPPCFPYIFIHGVLVCLYLLDCNLYVVEIFILCTPVCQVFRTTPGIH